MDISEIKNQIMNSEEFIISEVKKLQTLYKLKKEIRYAQSRTTEQDTESVAEHIFGMHCLVDYFLPLEDTDRNWDLSKIRTMVQYHDIDEIETGDVLGHLKSKVAEQQERKAAEIVIRKLPSIMQENIRLTLDEYDKQSTIEARFVKAIDKIEPVIHLYNKEGKRNLNDLKVTKSQHDIIKTKYVAEFPTMKKIQFVMSEVFQREGYFYPETPKN